MKNHSHNILITAVLVLIISVSCTDNDKENEILINSTSESIKSVIDKYFPDYHCKIEKTKIFFENSSIEILPTIEHIFKKDNKWIYGIRYEIFLNNIKSEKLTCGSVGVDTSKENAIRTSIIEWTSVSGFPILDYFFNTKMHFNIENYKIYHGLTGIRGDKPNGWLDGSDAMHYKLLKPILKNIDKNPSDLNSASLLIFKESNTPIDGECLINGRDSKNTLYELKLFEWPKNSNFTLKQFYIILLDN